jgi:hypothetical protein
MKLALVAASATALLAVPATASAATLTISPERSCYGADETVHLRGTGFTPDATVTVTRDGTPLEGSPVADGTGTISAGLKLVKQGGALERRTYTATDTANPANTASAKIVVSDLDVTMRPTSGDPARPRQIAAKGFTTGSRTLWAHIVFRGSVRNVRIGKLKGACGTLRAQKRLFGRGAPLGQRLIHFDTSREFKKRTAQRESFTFRIFRG